MKVNLFSSYIKYYNMGCVNEKHKITNKPSKPEPAKPI